MDDDTDPASHDTVTSRGPDVEPAGVTRQHPADEGPLATGESPAAEEQPTTGPSGAHERRILLRPGSGRVVGGVAAGIAQYCDIDVVLVRIAFVVLAVVGGWGVLVYFLGWVLIPAEHHAGTAPVAGTGDADADDTGARHSDRRSRFLFVLFAVLAAIALVDVVSSGPWWPHWDLGVTPGFWLFFAALVGLGVLVLRAPHPDPAVRLRRLLLVMVVAAVALFTVAVAAVFTAEAATGVPLRGGIGDSQWRPGTPSQVAADYRLAVGRLDVDLSGVVFRSGVTTVTATVGIGQVVVVVPPGPEVSVTAHSGLGEVSVFGADNEGVGVVRSVDAPGAGTAAARTAATGTAATRIVLDVQAGLGQVQIVRAA